jgi:hypothetical protein
LVGVRWIGSNQVGRLIVRTHALAVDEMGVQRFNARIATR